MAEGKYQGAEIILKYFAAAGAALWLLISGKDFAEARKNEGERAKADLEVISAEWKLHPRGRVSISNIASDQEPWLSDPNLCTVTGNYALTNLGEAPIEITDLTFRVLKVPLGLPPSATAEVASISMNTRIAKASPVFSETLPDSAGTLLPGEVYSRSFGFIVRKNDAMQYAIEASPKATYEVRKQAVSVPEYQFRAWTNLTPLCYPHPPQSANMPSSAGPAATGTNATDDNAAEGSPKPEGSGHPTTLPASPSQDRPGP